MEPQNQLDSLMEDNESFVSGTIAESGGAPVNPHVVANISEEDSEDEPFRTDLHNESTVVDVLAIQENESEEDSIAEQTNSDDGVYAYSDDASFQEREEPVSLVASDDNEMQVDSIDQPMELLQEQPEKPYEEKEEVQQEVLQEEDEQPQELHDEELLQDELQQQEGDQDPQEQDQDEVQENGEEHQQDESQVYLEEHQQGPPQEYLEEQQQEPHEEYVEEQRQDPPQDYLAEQQQDPPQDYAEEEQEDGEEQQRDEQQVEETYSGVFAQDAAVAPHVISQDSGDDDDDSESFRRDIQEQQEEEEEEEAKVMIDMGVLRSGNENDAASNADANNSIFANSYNGILEQLDTSQLTEPKSITPGNYDNVNGSEVDDFDEFLVGDDPNHEAASLKPDNFFPYPTKILIRHVAPSSQSPTKDSTSSPPPPEPLLTPRRINILVACLCFVLVASVGVAVGSFLAQQAGKTPPQSSGVNSNENSTTVSPTSSPTTFPTDAIDWSEGDCVDHPYKKFNINIRFGDQDCVFLQTHPSQRNRLCLPENEGYRWCPVTCGVCKENPDIPSNVPASAPPVTTSPTTDGTAARTISPTLEPTAPLVDTLAPTRAVLPTASPVVVTATLEPTAASDVRSVILAALTDSTVDLDDMDTPGGKAFDWVSRSSTGNDFPTWRMPQQFALAGLAYSAGVGAWLENGNECSWSGVTCNSNGRVTGIQLRGAGLRGNLFPELYMLSNSLMTLNAGQNRMRGPIPVELGLLQQLQVLQMDRNDFSGRIPGSLGNLNNLQILNLEENSLTGTLPRAMEKMPLRHFRFYSNELTGSIFDSWCLRDNLKLEADCDEIDCPCCSACF